MKIIVLRRKIIIPLLLGILVCVGFCVSQLTLSQPVFAPQQTELAIVIDDFGGYAAGIPAMMTIPYPLTFAILPFEEFARKQGEEAVSKGFEVIVHMPFQALHADPHWYGKKYISTRSTDEQIHQMINESFQILPMADGLSNHMGSRATTDMRVMKTVFEELIRQKRFFFDSKTSGIRTTIPELARQLQLPFTDRDLFLDDNASPDQMRRQLKKLIRIAQDKGTAIGIGHVGPTGRTLARILKEELPKYSKEGYRFVLLSDLIRGKKVLSQH